MLFKVDVIHSFTTSARGRAPNSVPFVFVNPLFFLHSLLCRHFQDKTLFLVFKILDAPIIRDLDSNPPMCSAGRSTVAGISLPAPVFKLFDGSLTGLRSFHQAISSKQKPHP